MDCLDHYKCVAPLNKWKDDNKILWLQVRLMGRVQTAFKQLPVVVRERGHDGLVAGLHQCLEPDSQAVCGQISLTAETEVRILGQL